MIQTINKGKLGVQEPLKGYTKRATRNAMEGFLLGRFP